MIKKPNRQSNSVTNNPALATKWSEKLYASNKQFRDIQYPVVKIPNAVDESTGKISEGGYFLVDLSGKIEPVPVSGLHDPELHRLQKFLAKSDCEPYFFDVRHDFIPLKHLNGVRPSFDPELYKGFVDGSIKSPTVALLLAEEVLDLEVEPRRSITYVASVGEYSVLLEMKYRAGKRMFDLKAHASITDYKIGNNNWVMSGDCLVQYNEPLVESNAQTNPYNGEPLHSNENFSAGAHFLFPTQEGGHADIMANLINTRLKYDKVNGIQVPDEVITAFDEYYSQSLRNMTVRIGADGVGNIPLAVKYDDESIRLQKFAENIHHARKGTYIPKEMHWVEGELYPSM